MPKTLVINRWNETFENADSRKRERLKYICCPSGTDSAGYIELVSHGSAGLVAFAIFQALCQAVGTFGQKRRGKLVKSCGEPMTVNHIATLIRVDACHLSAALELLASESVNWVSWAGEDDRSADNLPDGCRQSADPVPKICRESPAFVQGEGEGEGEGEGLDISQRACADGPTGKNGEHGVASDIPPCSIDQAVSVAAENAIPEDCARQWWLVHDARGWLDTKGNQLLRWHSSLIAYGETWRRNETKETKSNATHRRRTQQGNRNAGTLNEGQGHKYRDLNL